VLEKQDPEVYRILENERKRQTNGVQLIASEVCFQESKLFFNALGGHSNRPT
jgi:glycine/serine hydroxymethyltransferase